jgi:hypothetical protein
LQLQTAPGGLGYYMDIFGSRSARAGKVEGARQGRAASRVARAQRGVTVSNSADDARAMTYFGSDDSVPEVDSPNELRNSAGRQN